ncbi:hypothetical protein ABZ901_34375, partial [Actinacidiphila alni]
MKLHTPTPLRTEETGAAGGGAAGACVVGFGDAGGFVVGLAVVRFGLGVTDGDGVAVVAGAEEVTAGRVGDACAAGVPGEESAVRCTASSAPAATAATAPMAAAGTPTGLC